jgi:peptidoglycan/xylan/chitin deacetylase (PgdA/CDA1 family)
MLSKEQERAVMERCVKLITEFTGKYPRGYTAPSWSVSNHTVEILESFGLLYDHSFNHHDSQPYWLPHNPSYVEAHSSTVVEDWMHPMSQLQLSNIIEIPGNWNLDDWPPFNPGPGSQGYVDPDSILNVWKAQFDYYYLESDTFIFPISLHPDVSGKAHVQMMLEKFIEYINSYKGVEWITFEEMATEFKSGRIAGYTINSGVINNV